MTHRSIRTRSAAIGRTACRLALAGAAVLIVAGCASQDRGITNAVPLTSVDDRHPILQPGEFAVFDMALGKLEGRMSARKRTELEVYLRGYLENGGGPLFIASPEGTANEHAAAKRLGELREVAFRVGVQEDSMVFEPYTPREGARGFPVSLRYQVNRVTVPECGHISSDLASNPRNMPYENFGCSRQRALALMVANPNDLRRPRAQTPRYPGERDRVIEAYRDGDLTASQNNQTSGGELSDVGGE